MNRRTVLAGLGGLAISSIAGCTGTKADELSDSRESGAEEGEGESRKERSAPSVAIPDQESDGRSVTVDVRTDGDASLYLVDPDDDRVVGSRVESLAEQSGDALEISLEAPLDEGTTLRADLYRSNGEKLDEDWGFVALRDGSPTPTVTLPDQESDGQSVTVAHARTDVDASLRVVDVADDRTVGSSVELFAGETLTDFAITFEEPLDESATLRADLYRPNGAKLADDRGFVALGDESSTPSVTFSDQESDGRTIRVGDVRTDADGALLVSDRSGQTIGAETIGPTDGSSEDISVTLDEPLAESQQVTVELYQSNGGRVARDRGYVTVDLPRPSVWLHDQTSDGRSITVARVATDVDASLFVFDRNGDDIGGSGVRFEAGETAENVTVTLDEPIQESQSVRVTLYESNGGPIAEAYGYVSVE